MALLESIERSNRAIGADGPLRVADDVELLNPCARRTAAGGERCGGDQICDAKLGESCIGGVTCGCTNGEKRASSREACQPVESWRVPIWVLRRDRHNLVYNSSFANPLDFVTKDYMQAFERGVGECKECSRQANSESNQQKMLTRFLGYPHTALRNAFVSAEVNEIADPMLANASLDAGLLFNATMNFRKGAVRTPADVYRLLLKYILEQNHFQVGKSSLFLSPLQPSLDPFSACYKVFLTRLESRAQTVCIWLAFRIFAIQRASASWMALIITAPAAQTIATSIRVIQASNACQR